MSGLNWNRLNLIPETLKHVENGQDVPYSDLYDLCLYLLASIRGWKHDKKRREKESKQRAETLASIVEIAVRGNKELLDALAAAQKFE